MLYEREVLAFLARPLVQANLPYRRVDGGTFERVAGRLTLTFQAPPHVGLPYGRYPRLLLVWVATQAVKTQCRHLDLGPSLYSFMGRELGLTPSGGDHGPRGRLLEQMKRLFSTTITVTWNGESSFAASGFRIAASTYICWTPVEDQGLAWTGRLTLSSEFYTGLLESAVPLDISILRALTSSLALDIYCWLSYRGATLQRPLRLPWNALHSQFGSQTARTRDFRRAFLRELRDVLALYPARVNAGTEALVVRPGTVGDGRRV